MKRKYIYIYTLRNSRASVEMETIEENEKYQSMSARTISWEAFVDHSSETV